MFSGTGTLQKDENSIIWRVPGKKNRYEKRRWVRKGSNQYPSPAIIHPPDPPRVIDNQSRFSSAESKSRYWRDLGEKTTKRRGLATHTRHDIVAALLAAPWSLMI